MKRRRTAPSGRRRRNWPSPLLKYSLLGEGDFICSQRGFLLRPLPGLVSHAGFAALRPASAEVADVYTVPLEFFRSTPPERYTYDLSAPCAGGLPL